MELGEVLRPGVRVGTVVLEKRLEALAERPQWLLRCDCGALHVKLDWEVVGRRWRPGGPGHPPVLCPHCAPKRTNNPGNRRHGLSGMVEYRTWYQAYVRCHRTANASYADYGGRGIRMHPDWHPPAVPGLLRFLAHVGKRPSSKHSLDRIDNDGHYEPGNVRWATQRVQNSNTRRSSKDPWKPYIVEELVHRCVQDVGVWSRLFLFVVGAEEPSEWARVLQRIRTPSPLFMRRRDQVRRVLIKAAGGAAVKYPVLGGHTPSWRWLRLGTRRGAPYQYRSDRNAAEAGRVFEGLMEGPYREAFEQREEAAQ